MTPDPDRPLVDCLAGRGAARVLIVVAHPDDEVLGCGGLLTHLRDVAIVHVTDGAPREGDDARRHGFASLAAYAAARAGEARAALALAEILEDCLHGFDVPDQDAPLHLAAVARRLVPMLAGVDLVLTHAFEGGHGDHDAVAFAVHAAVEHIELNARPLIVEMPFYHASSDGWRRQTFLSCPAAGPERVLDLDAEAQAVKGRMLACHATQGDTLRSFDLVVERFRVAPPTDFAARPHGGDLLYERHGWNLDWPRWLTRVHAAEAELGRAPPS